MKTLDLKNLSSQLDRSDWSYLWEDTLADGTLSRERMTYLLKAARSRRRGNVERKPFGYRIKDCGLRLIRSV